MNWRDISELGSILEENRLDQAGLQPAATFLREVVEGFASASARFYGAIGELPFIYRERQVQAELLPAMHRAADAVLVEQGVGRKKGRSLSTGWLDYAVRYRKEYVFFIELKFAWVAIQSQGVRKDALTAWKAAYQQLDDLHNSELVDFGYDLGVKDHHKLIKIALLITPSYQGANNPKNLKPIVDLSAIEAVHKRLLDRLNNPQPPNLSYTWALPARLQEPLEYDENWSEIYPCASFVARVQML